MSKTVKPKQTNSATSLALWLSGAFVKQLYACINDISCGWIDESPFPTHKFESYTNLTRSKEDRTEVTKIFTISAEFKELMKVLLNEYISEISEVDAVKTDTAASLIEKLELAGTKHGVAATMARIVNLHRASWGETLATDDAGSDDGMREIIFSIIPAEWQKFGMTFQGSLTDFYIDFTKSIAYLLATTRWFTGKTVSESDVIGILYTHGIAMTTISDISGSIVVEKKPTKPRVKKAADAADSAATPPAAPTTPVTPVTPAEVAAIVDAVVKQ